ncbi:MAG: hypothetical protein COV96_00645 [Candidatus Zambryskibacteria bacterium CG11_big_fil_rev_8_21_14_0_20_42_18]|uniref:Glycosyl transferase family 1 domain-containing protein n=1 Tax=Candidatus Zambryskibacteria bacterium CG_4_9_14_3_um_filter_42_15 TaxID=1975112 RepID=A0A2M7WS33_9BACT|nr:MAG: hypothetical protein COV96_00645 [Candidatus Zambryskibacteria bacterium CG11_big_fil_rev_8_21_14_0_20_42_18]PJA32817.1 MAG: hypothetical protein CO185_01585 [Candidatus Zambryskibacteria bacterium CG_4_9_14_3_um_filter_42_15]
MKLLILTQKVDRNDPILGFFHRWIEEFSKHYESLVVICLEKGEYNLPENVKVFSLGKESQIQNTMIYHSVVRKLYNIARFYKYIWQERKNYDNVFVHMNPEYIILGGLFWRLWGRKVALWYVHKAVNLRIWLAEKFANIIVTSAPESFKLKSKKVRYIGHGIDTKIFKPVLQNRDGPVKFLHVGRITRIKNIDFIIRSIGDKSLTLVGEPIMEEDKRYKKELENLAEKIKAKLLWLGSVINTEMPKIYAGHTISINSTPDGGMDKAVLESLATGTPVFTANCAFTGLFGGQAGLFIYKHGDVEDLTKKLDSWLQNNQKSEIMRELSNRVQSEYSVETIISKIVSNLNE